MERIIVWISATCRHRRIRVLQYLRRDPILPSNLTMDWDAGKHHPSCSPIWPCST